MPDKDFHYSGEWQNWKVPDKVEWLYITLNGAGSQGRHGGQVTGRLNVKNKDSIWVLVGAEGNAPVGGTGGGRSFGGGAAGGDGTVAGGWGGGGATALRLNTKTGRVLAVAAGAGGNSGDGGKGGNGGAEVGAAGLPGVSAGDGEVGNATGGTQSQGGFRGTSALGVEYDGHDAPSTILARAGAGGSITLPGTYGGGGGGGGYRAGGGGQAGQIGTYPAGGGGGGSNYIDPVVGYTSSQGEGNANNGSVTFFWVAPGVERQPPSAPSEVKIDGKDEVPEQATMSVGKVLITAKVNDPAGQRVRLVARYSADKAFKNPSTVASDPVPHGDRAKVHLAGLSQNTLYYVRLYTRDSTGALSLTYNSASFWTNRFPTEPNISLPPDNGSVSELDSTVFDWAHVDPDPNSEQSAFRLRWRRAATSTVAAGEWHKVEYETSSSTWIAPPEAFGANSSYEWTVKTRDPQGGWGPFAIPRSFFVTGATAPPTLLSPQKDEAVDVTDEVVLTWAFRNPGEGNTQANADVRYRVVDTTDWVTLLGVGVTDQSWTLDTGALMPGYRYEWQARTRDTINSALSQWAESAYFYTVATPGTGLETVFSDALTIDGSLGVGSHRVFIYDRGGQIIRGEITPMSSLAYSRKRDDISNALVTTNGFGDDCCQLLSVIRCWLHEVVIFRDGVRVWEGPITRITYRPDSVEIEAKDVMAYVYRRIMRQGYNDSYRIVNGVQLGQATVVQRATQITMNALAPDDPNVLPYLTSLNFPDDAGQSRVMPDFSKTAWEDIDDMAATSGLDYVTVGRRIIYNDTHRPLGRLPEMRDEHFSDPPVVTEYGMQLATFFGVTNNNGVYGGAERDHTAYGVIELLASAYGETAASGTGDVLTSAERAALEKKLSNQAERNIAGRWPTPLVVRVPDNSTVHPDTPIRFNYLIPGVWIPLRSRGTCREFSQWQKLDLVNIEDGPAGEKISVTMSPAPNGGQDPDAGGFEDEGV